MWKLIVGFVLFGALALYILTKSGGDIDLTGEKHDMAPAAEAPAAASVPEAAASAAAVASAASQ